MPTLLTPQPKMIADRMLSADGFLSHRTAAALDQYRFRRNVFAEHDSQDRRSDESGSSGHEDNQGVSRLGNHIHLQSYEGNNQSHFAAWRHSHAHFESGLPSGPQHGKTAAYQLGKECQQSDHDG